MLEKKMEKTVQNIEEDADRPPRTSLFIMPGDSLAHLHKELEKVVGKKLCENVLYKYGMNCGRAMAGRFNLKVRDLNKFPAFVSEIWSELGLGRLEISKSEKGYEIEIRNGIEGEALGALGKEQVASCHFTRGYLAGVADYVTKETPHVKELDCICKGDEFCSMILTV